MQSIRRALLVRAFQIFDLLALSFAALVARGKMDPVFRALPRSPHELLNYPVSMRSALAGMALLVCWQAVFSAKKLHASRRLSTLSAELGDVTVSTLLAMATTVLVVWVFEGSIVTARFLLSFVTLALAILLASRLALRSLLRQVRLRGRNLRHVIIVGTNPNALEYARQLRSRPELGYLVAGFVDEPAFAGGAFPAEVPLLCDFGGFPAYLRTHVVDEVVVFVPMKSFYDRISQVVALCEEQGIVVRVRPDPFNTRLGDLQFEETPGLSLPLISVYTGRMRGWQMALKRVIDVAGAAILLTCAGCLMAIVAVAIRLSSKGPVFFIQERVGMNKRRFRLYKFRTMVVDAEQLQAKLESLNEVGGPVFKIRNDPRIFPLGHFLRRTSLDELPQLFNVLKGDMSLVGPRPLPVRDYDGFKDDGHRRRFSVRPGLTCLWQVSGRNDIPFDRWMQLDMEYIDTWSLQLDFLILARTLPAVLRSTGA